MKVHSLLIALIAALASVGAAHEARALAPGDLIVTDELVGLIHVDAFSGQTTTIPTPGLAINPLAGVVIESNGKLILISHNDLVRLDPETGQQTILTSGGFLDDFVGRVALGPLGEILFTSNAGGAGPAGSIVSVDPATGVQTALVTGGLLFSVWDVAFTSTSDTFVESSSWIVRIDGQTGLQSWFLQAEDYGRLTVLPDDDLLVHETVGISQHSLLRIDSATGGESRIPVPAEITTVTNDASGAIYYSWCTGLDFCSVGEVIRITPEGAHEVLYSGIAPLGFAIAPARETLPSLSRYGLILLVVLLLCLAVSIQPWARRQTSI